MSKMPFMRFFPADYLISTRSLTDTEKAVWMDLLCYMWLKPENRGYLEMLPDDLSRLVGRDRLTLEVTLDALVQKQICELNRLKNGLIFVGNRRMMREQKSLNLTLNRVKNFNKRSINAPINAQLTHLLTHKKLEARRQITTTTTPEGFEEFWETYPKKQGKAMALKAWVKLEATKELRLKILDAVKAQLSLPQWTKEGGQFIPLPASWLNGRRWEDEVAPGPRNWEDEAVAAALQRKQNAQSL